MKPIVETVIKNAANTIGEGPHWEEQTQTLLFVDVAAGNIHRYNTVTKIEDKRHIEGEVSLVVPRKSGGYVVANGLNLSHLDWGSGQITPLATPREIAGCKFNDGKCDAMGRLWAGTLGPKLTDMDFTPEAGTLYSLDKDLTLRKHVDKITLTNGITWTNNNTKMFYIDTQPKEIMSFDFDLASGNISNKQILVKFPENRVGDPDGMTSDVDGKLWCAYIFANCIIRLDQETEPSLDNLAEDVLQLLNCLCGKGKHFVGQEVRRLKEENIFQRQQVIFILIINIYQKVVISN